MKKRALLNIIFSILMQLVAIINGLVIPKLILNSFGSEVNGLITSLNQFLNYIALLEGGLGSVVLAALYKPLVESDMNKVAKVLNTAQKFFKKIASIFLIYVFVVAIVYPMIANTSFSRLYIGILTLILAIGLFVQYYFSISYKLLLQADEKVYYVYCVQIVTNIVSFIMTYVSLKLFPSVHLVKLLSAIVFVVQPIVYSKYVKKNYKIVKTDEYDNTLIKDRWSCFGQNIAYFIHTNTDVVILTFFENLKKVSVYSVHLMIVNCIRNLIMSISNAYTPILGKKLSDKCKDSANDSLDQFEYVMFNFATIIFGSCMYLLPSFVMIYTKGVEDVNYYMPVFAVLLILAEYVYCVREPYIKVAYTTGKFQETAKGAYIEAFINIVISLFLVYKYSLMGVAIGTLVGMIYRMLYQVHYIKHNIIFRPYKNFIKRLIIATLTFIISPYIVSTLDNTGSGILIYWIKNGVLCVVVYFIVNMGLNIVMDYKMTCKQFKAVMSKRRKINE